MSYILIRVWYIETWSISEEEKRFKIFRENMKRVNQLNENELGDAKYGVTEFSDMSGEY